MNEKLYIVRIDIPVMAMNQTEAEALVFAYADAFTLQGNGKGECIIIESGEAKDEDE